MRQPIEMSPAFLIAIIAVLIIIAIFLLVLKMGLIREACLATVDQAAPGFVQYLNDVFGMEFRPLKWFCRTLMDF